MHTNTGSKIKRILFDIFDIIAFLVFVIGLVLFIRFFIFNPYSVVWQSMAPNLGDGDFLIIDKIGPTFKDYERWDIVVFVAEWRKTPFIKRIIWMPWETVTIQEGKIEICNENEECELFEETYLPSTSKTRVKCNSVYQWAYKVEWWYFVIGDNRDHSTDSRCCFTIWCYEWSNFVVRKEDIIGRLLIRLRPLSEIQIF